MMQPTPRLLAVRQTYADPREAMDAMTDYAVDLHQSLLGATATFLEDRPYLSDAMAGHVLQSATSVWAMEIAKGRGSKAAFMRWVDRHWDGIDPIPSIPEGILCRPSVPTSSPSPTAPSPSSSTPTPTTSSVSTADTPSSGTEI